MGTFSELLGKALSNLTSSGAGPPLSRRAGLEMSQGLLNVNHLGESVLPGRDTFHNAAGNSPTVENLRIAGSQAQRESTKSHCGRKRENIPGFTISLTFNLCDVISLFCADQLGCQLE